VRVLNVNAYLDRVSGGGNVERTFQLSHALIRAGHECSILASDYRLSPTSRREFDPIQLHLFQTLLGRFFVPKIAPRRVQEIVAWADIIHLIGHWSIINVLVAKEALRQGIPYVVSPAGSLKVIGRSRIPKRIFNVLFGIELLHRSTGKIAITANEMADYACYGIPKEQVRIIPNGINPDEYPAVDPTTLRRNLGLGDDPYLLYVGRLNPIKGPDLLLQAFSQLAVNHRSLHLVLAGPDQGMKTSLLAQAHRNRLQDRVHLAGHLSGEVKSCALHGAEIVIVPSRHEAMSIVVLEAGICKRPVVITNQCGFDQVQEVGGGKVCSATAEGIAQALNDLLSLPKEELDKMGLRFYGYVAKNFTWNAQIQELVQFYQSILE
jgi:glycosyltransferase involved in cell wall biosynthesis